MTVGELIDRLEAEPDHAVPFGFNGFHSWRGDYSQVAFAPANDVSVHSMLDCARNALGATVFGWKGGEFLVTYNTNCFLTPDYGYCGYEDDHFTKQMLELMLKAGELRALLLTAQRVEQAKTCQWRSAVGCWDTECGKSEHLRSANYCPNCGGLVTYD